MKSSDFVLLYSGDRVENDKRALQRCEVLFLVSECLFSFKVLDISIDDIKEVNVGNFFQPQGVKN